MRHLALGLFAVAAVAVASTAEAKRAVCPDGRFLSETRILPGSADGAFDAVVLADGRISIASGCEPTRAKLKGLKTGDTRVRAQWKTCAGLKKVKLRGTIVQDEEPCRRLVGTLKAKKTDAIAVAAARSRCGDGLVDGLAGESCEPPGTSACSDTCQSTGVIDAPARTWTWVPFDDAYCANGSTTGIGVNPGDAGARLVIFMMGGGACWDDFTCYQIGTASNLAGYGASQFANDAGGLLNASLFDRTDVANPFRNDSFVFVPYCTGDVHAGSNPDAVWGGHPTKHVGFQNMGAYLTRIAPTFADASRVILSGSSAGGFGALTNWWQTQQAFGDVRVDLLDDSGPPLPAPYLSEALEGTWRAAWNLAAATPPGCTACADDLTAVIGFYGTEFVGHRAALLSYTQDGVIGAFFQQPGPGVEAGLDALATVMAPYDIWRHFFVAGSSHVLLFSPDVTQNAVSLRTFLTQMVTDDPAWASVEP